MVGPLDPNMPKETLAGKWSPFTDGVNEIIGELERNPSPPYDDLVNQIHSLIQSYPSLGPRALQLLNQAIKQLESGSSSMLPSAIQSLLAVGNNVTLTTEQVNELQYMINEIKTGQPPYTQQIQDLTDFLNSKPPLSPYEKDCVKRTIKQLEAGGLPADAAATLDGLQSECTLTPDQLIQLGDILNAVKNGSPPFTQEEEAVKQLLNSQPPISPYERDCLKKALDQLQACGMTHAAIFSLQNMLPM